MAINSLGDIEFRYVSVLDEIDWSHAEDHLGVTKKSYRSNVTDEIVDKLQPLPGKQLTIFHLKRPQDPKVLAEAQDQEGHVQAAIFLAERFIMSADGLLCKGRPVHLKRNAIGILDETSRCYIPFEVMIEIGGVLMERSLSISDPLSS